MARKLFGLRTDVSGLKSLKDRFGNKKVKAAFNTRVSRKVGSQTIREMKKLIKKGISPIRAQDGGGKFKRYKPSYLAQIKRSNGIFSEKKKTPVNLKLTGKFLRALTSEPRRDGRGFGTRIFYRGKKEQLKEQGHRDGANGQRKRPTLPQGSEKWRSAIEKQFKKIYVDAMRKFLRKRLR